MFLLINAVNTTAKTFRVIGDVTTLVSAGSYIQVLKSTGNNGIYKLANAVYSSGYTTLTTIEPIPSSVVDGNIAAGVYELKFSDPGLPGKTGLILAPWSTNSTTSLKFNGKAALDFGEYQQQNTLRVLENFASAVPPANPTLGQHWFDSANSAIKVYTTAGWSSDISVENGSITFRDPQHPTPNTKYFLTAAEPGPIADSGVTLYPAINPTAGMALFRVTESTGVVVFEVDYKGQLISANPITVTADATSTFANAISVNVTGGSATSILAKNNIVVSTGDVVVDSGRKLTSSAGASVLLTNTTVLRGATTTSVEIQALNGSVLTSFETSQVTFYVPVNITTLNATNLSVTGTATINAANITSLAVSGTSSLTTLTVSGTSTLAGVSATSLSVSGVTTLSTTNITGGLSVAGAATFGDRVIVTYAPLVGSDVTNKTYVDGIAANKVSKTGDSMSGNLNMGGVARVTNALDPINPQDYVTLNSLNNIVIDGGTF